MEEGYSTNKQPMFRGVTYDYWKEQKIAHFKSIHIDLWDVVENGNYITYEDELNEFPRKGGDIQRMFGCIQTILNELRSLGRTYDNYDHIDKILRSLSRKSRPQVMQSYPSRALDRRL
ncbi:hypothetical protein JHK87_050122 [Glycine soja]|nr:hypothetical protein JHK87_050122 [Glycine soja]